VKREFVATAYVVEDHRVLLVYHKKLEKWLPPGGHIDPDETPTDAARREVLEETGLEVELVSQEAIWVERWNAKSLERPYLCLLEEIPAYRDVPAHQHMDFIYLARMTGGELCQNEEETHDIRWFTLEEVEQLQSDEDIFVETQEVIRTILTTQSVGV